MTEMIGHVAETAGHDEPKTESVTMGRNPRSRYRNQRSRWSEIPSRTCVRWHQEWAWQKNDRNTVGWQGWRGCGWQSNRLSWTKTQYIEARFRCALVSSFAHSLAHRVHLFPLSAASGSGEIVFSRSVACGGHSTGMSADTVCLLPDEECHVRSL